MKKSLKTKMKLLGLAAMSFALGLCLQGANQNAYNVNADENAYNVNADENATVPAVTGVVDSFEMVKGAWVRGSISDPTDTGLAFSATVDNTQFASLSALGTVKVGFAIAPKNYADVYALTDEYLFGSSAKYYFDDNQIDGTLKDGKMEIFHISAPAVSVSGTTRTYKGSIINFGNDPDDLLREYVCAGYIEFTPTGTTNPQYLMAEHFEGDVRNSTRSMVHVAQRALEKGVVPSEHIDNFTNTYLPETGVLDQQVKYTTNVYVNDILIESKTDNVANINVKVSYENEKYDKFAGYNPVENAVVYAGDNNTVLDIRLTPQMETKDTVYLSAWTAYNFNNPTHLFPITKDVVTVETGTAHIGTAEYGAATLLDATGKAIQKQTGAVTGANDYTTAKPALGYGMTYATGSGNRNFLVKDYGLLGKELEYLALYENGTAAKYTVVPVTKAIATRKDLEDAFNSGSGIKAGYYVLTDDIDMGTSTWNNNSGRYMAPGSSNVMSTFSGTINGFHGIFDGLGHTIKNLTTEKTFFGSIQPGSIIRNIGFTNVKETTVRGFLAGVCAAELNNVYVSYAEDQVKSLALTQDSYNGLVLNNVVVDYTNAMTPTATEKGPALSYYGVMEPFGNNKTKLDFNHNFFVVSKMPLLMKLDKNDSDPTGAKWNGIIDGYNQTKEAQDYIDALGSTFPSGTPGISHTNKSVLRFDEADDMKNYLKEDQEKGKDKTLDLSGFNAEYWTFNPKTGELTWNSANN